MDLIIDNCFDPAVGNADLGDSMLYISSHNRRIEAENTQLGGK